MESRKYRVLIVEDDIQLKASLRDKLVLFCEIFEAEDGEQAIGQCLDHQPDLIILDLLLPKIDGFKVLEKIRSYPDVGISAVPVIVLSNLWSQKDILQVQGLKINEYFVKANTSLDQVIEKARQILQGDDKSGKMSKSK